MRRPRVLIAYKSLPRYRVDFFNMLRDRLAADAVDLKLIHGQPSGHELARGDTTDIEWATFAQNRVLRARGFEFIWQPVLRAAQEADLVIVEQASRLLANYALLGLQGLKRTRVAFWGHGANMQRHRADSRGELVKRIVSRYPHWWFAYTEGSKRRVEELGYPPERITVVCNAIDTVSLQAACGRVTTRDEADFYAAHDITPDMLGLFVGGLYDDKDLEFLMEAADAVHQARPTFRLLIIGDGPQRSFVESAVASRPHVTYLGPRFGSDRAVAMRCASVLLMPGLVGLVVLDAFAAELPLITRSVEYHSPEIEYLEDGRNGLVVDIASGVSGYRDAVLAVLDDEVLRRRLQEGCRSGAFAYTVENMVDRFRGGVMRALDAQRRPAAA